MNSDRQAELEKIAREFVDAAAIENALAQAIEKQDCWGNHRVPPPDEEGR